MEADLKTTSILLGKWDEKLHSKWMADHPDKRPRPGKTPRMVSHFYSGGDVCPETGKPRRVEVKLKCKFLTGSPDAVALYLLEPQTCDYILGIESQFFCHLLNNVDENGLFVDLEASLASVDEASKKEEKNQETKDKELEAIKGLMKNVKILNAFIRTSEIGGAHV